MKNQVEMPKAFEAEGEFSALLLASLTDVVRANHLLATCQSFWASIEASHIGAT